MRRCSERGALSLVMLLLLLATVAAAAALTHAVTLAHRSAAREQACAQALCLAESGIEVAAHRLAAGASYAGERGTPLGAGAFSVAVRSRAPLEIVATGEALCGGMLAVRRTVRVRGTLTGGRFQRREWREMPPSAHLECFSE